MPMKLVSSIIISIFSVFIGISIYHLTFQKKVAYVKTDKLVYGYTGMKEAQINYQHMVKEWDSQTDSLKALYQSKLNLYRNGHSDDKKLTSELEYLGAKLEQLNSKIEQKAQEEDQKITKGILIQINSYLVEWAKNNSYDYLIGTSESNTTIIYGKDNLDVTDELLSDLNKDYSKNNLKSLGK